MNTPAHSACATRLDHHTPVSGPWHDPCAGKPSAGLDPYTAHPAAGTHALRQAE